jgi:signal recognition particle subunit SRP68
MAKAARAAEDLATAVSDVVTSGATNIDALEAYAYAGQMRAAAQFEKQCWEACLKDYSVSYAIYRSLMTSSPADSDTFKELLADPIEPSIQFAAYQLKTPRTVPIEVIARKAFPQTNAFLVHEIDKLDPTVLRHTGHETKMEVDDDVPKTLNWRGRKVRIEDAHIASAWAATEEAKSKLAETLSSPDAAVMMPKEIAAAYEGVLTASQDAVDATRQAIGALIDEGVPQADARMQSLQITRTAVNYEMISWRIGRNRVLMGSDDGANEDYADISKRKAKKQKEALQTSKVKVSQKLAKLKERVALYDGALQSLEETMGLPGVPADEELSSRIKASARYFTALKYVSPFLVPCVADSP